MENLVRTTPVLLFLILAEVNSRRGGIAELIYAWLNDSPVPIGASRLRNIARLGYLRRSA
jgi:hypothetical protein